VTIRSSGELGFFENRQDRPIASNECADFEIVGITAEDADFELPQVSTLYDRDTSIRGLNSGGRGTVESGGNEAPDRVAADAERSGCLLRKEPDTRGNQISEHHAR